MKDPPAAESGRVYKTIDARCKACRVYGGREKRCIALKTWRAWGNKHSKCPRVDLDLDNAEAASVLMFTLDERLRALAPALVEALLADVPPQRRALVLTRVRAALMEPTVMAIMYPKHEE